MPVTPIKTRRLYQEVADQLLKLIAKGEFRPGERLPSERELAASLQVSRPTIREAMIALELADAIQIRKGAGIYVCGHPIGSAARDAGPGPFELLEARILIEGEAAALAADNISEEQLQELRHANSKMEALVLEHDPTEGIDMLFHQIIGRATGNSAMSAAVDQLWEFRAQMPMWRGLHELIADIGKQLDWNDDQHAVLDHREIIDALATRKPDLARQAMRTHLERVSEVLMAASELNLIDADSRLQPISKEAL